MTTYDGPPQDGTLEDADPADRIAAVVWAIIAREVKGPRAIPKWADVDDDTRRAVLFFFVMLLAYLNREE